MSDGPRTTPESSPFSAAPEMNNTMRLGLIATLQDAEECIQRVWDMGQTGGMVREVALDALGKVRAVKGILEQVQA